MLLDLEAKEELDDETGLVVAFAEFVCAAKVEIEPDIDDVDKTGTGVWSVELSVWSLLRGDSGSEKLELKSEGKVALEFDGEPSTRIRGIGADETGVWFGVGYDGAGACAELTAIEEFCCGGAF